MPALRAEGEDGAAIAARPVITDNAVHQRIGNIFAKLHLPPTGGGHRRVRAVLAHLGRG
ncbi:hypothetical protein GCM10009759_28320 [Kitasatospora saccharophila]|uniref:HTH luxR-type domain-containing protein n=1 Tax=Kitasatospora saccharophila TaxID=407973 RepID=A0ABN2WTQ5_9ACTN